MLRTIVAEGFRIVAPSRSGYLGTPLPTDASAEAQADAHACLLDALGIRRAAVVGASAGASSAIQFALRHPQRIAALVLLVPAIYVPRPDAAASVHVPAGMERVFSTVLRSDFLLWIAIRTMRSSLLRTTFATPPELVAAADHQERQRVRRMFDCILPVSVRRSGLLNDAAVIGSLPRYPLEAGSVPTLAISVQDDLFGTFEGARYSAAHIPGARFIGYPDSGHVWVGRHREVMREIAGFLRSKGDEAIDVASDRTDAALRAD